MGPDIGTHHHQPISTGDEFSWGYQNSTKQGGNGAVEAQISTECTQESGDSLPGIYAEYFDNEGVSFNTATMPDLIDRVPDHIRTETSLAYSSSNNPYSGLDDRFKNNWGARFSGLIEIPETGNWTLYLNSDDGSELWIDGVSAIQNYGSHGMRENSVSNESVCRIVMISGLNFSKAEGLMGCYYLGKAQTCLNLQYLRRLSMWLEIIHHSQTI